MSAAAHLATALSVLAAVPPALALWRRRPSTPLRRRRGLAAPAGQRRGTARIWVPAAVLLAAGTLVQPAVGALVGLAIPLGVAGRARAGRDRAARARFAELDALVTLAAAALQSGSSMRRALAEALEWLDGELAGAVRAALAHADRGELLSDRLEQLVATDAPELRPLARIVVEAERYGAPAAPALAALQHDLRLERRHRLERDARRLPVRLLFPLVVGVLPAFVLLAVVPMLAGALGGLAPLRAGAGDAPSRGVDAPVELISQQGVGP